MREVLARQGQGSRPSVALGSDHGGFALKQRLKGFLDAKGYAVQDVGTHSPEACD